MWLWNCPENRYGPSLLSSTGFEFWEIIVTVWIATSSCSTTLPVSLLLRQNVILRLGEIREDGVFRNLEDIDWNSEDDMYTIWYSGGIRCAHHFSN